MYRQETGREVGKGSRVRSQKLLKKARLPLIGIGRSLKFGILYMLLFWRNLARMFLIWLSYQLGQILLVAYIPFFHQPQNYHPLGWQCAKLKMLISLKHGFEAKAIYCSMRCKGKSTGKGLCKICCFPDEEVGCIVNTCLYVKFYPFFLLKTWSWCIKMDQSCCELQDKDMQRILVWKEKGTWPFDSPF